MRINQDLELMLGRAQRKRNGEDIPAMSNRQYQRFRMWCKRYLVEICCAVTFITMVLADTRLWVLLFIGAWGPVICLWRWRNRDITKGDELAKQQLTNKKPADATNIDEPRSKEQG